MAWLAETVVVTAGRKSGTNMSGMPMSWKRKLYQIALVLSALFLIFTIDWRLHGKKAVLKQEIIRQEISAIKPYPNSVRLSQESTFKASNGVVVDRFYVASGSAASVNEWYSKELVTAGWTSTRVEERHGPMERVVRFCRNAQIGQLTIYLDHGGSAQDTSLRYDFQIAWGLAFEC
jgi:hypothetical protein